MPICKKTKAFNKSLILLICLTISACRPSEPSSSTGNAVLNWTIPTQNTDGSALTDLTGYVIYYGTSPNTDELTNSITISGGSTTTATIDGLTAGTTYYFSIASVSSTGGKSAKSNPASKTI